MGNRKKKGKRSPSNQKPQFTSNPPATADNPQGDLFTRIITLYRKPHSPGGLWEKHLKIYRMFHSIEAANDNRCKVYRDKLERVVLDGAVKSFSSVQHTYMGTPGPMYTQTSPPRTANLVATMDDALAKEMFYMLSRLLGFTGGHVLLFEGGTGTLGEVFGEQLFIAFLEWLLKNNRPYFETLEDHRPLKEYTEPASSSEGGQPASPASQPGVGNLRGSLFQQYQQHTRYFSPGTFYEKHFDIYLQLQQQDEKKYNHYKVFKTLAIHHLIIFFDNSNSRDFSIPPPARLVTSMGDKYAVAIFLSIDRLLVAAGFRVRLVPDFKEQLFIGVLEWMLEHERKKFNYFESIIIMKGSKLKVDL